MVWSAVVSYDPKRQHLSSAFTGFIKKQTWTSSSRISVIFLIWAKHHKSSSKCRPQLKLQQSAYGAQISKTLKLSNLSNETFRRTFRSWGASSEYTQLGKLSAAKPVMIVGHFVETKLFLHTSVETLRLSRISPTWRFQEGSAWPEHNAFDLKRFGAVWLKSRESYFWLSTMDTWLALNVIRVTS